MLGIRSGAFLVDFEHKLWSIRSLAIVSLGVSYKYILALVFSEEQWNFTKFVTPYFLALSMGSGKRKELLKIINETSVKMNREKILISSDVFISG